ncbi:protein FAM169B isoform X2 [Heterodontus francisci]|uniref:protein FAM169B isoform X2 n=1 Tax=Heterodontus francisci TaxID=7792 RepID=UPI00355ACEA3
MEVSATETDRAICYPVDILTSGDWDALKQASEAYQSRLRDRNKESTQCFNLTNGEKVAVTPSSVAFLQVHGEDSEHRILGLLDPRNNQAVVALYLCGRWWSVDDVLRTSNDARQELLQVLSVGEQIVLYLLNRVVYLSREWLPGNIPFRLHPANQSAKIVWRNREAVGFYTVKQEGSLCTDCTSQCYQLPVLDTVFVRRIYQRLGIGLRILHDFCSTFPDHEALGISRPISAAMYKVCSKYLQSMPHEQDRVWEVEPPGDWSQRLNVWLQIQMGDISSVITDTTGGDNALLHSQEEKSNQQSGDDDVSRFAKVHNPQTETSQVILEPSERGKEQGSGSPALKGESSGESNMIEGKTEETRSETDTATNRKRRNEGLLQTTNSKLVKLAVSHPCD